VFFAFWPDAATTVSLARATRRAVRLSGGRPTPKERLHITVAFLGELTEVEFERACGAVPVQTGAFDLTLDLLGFWPESRVLWLAPRVVPAPLRDLERRLWAALEARGFEREPRIYRPHMTLARRARAVDEAVAAVLWRVEDVALVESLPAGGSVHYEVLRRWPL
jgi:2'-5' RNA ligase